MISTRARFAIHGLSFLAGREAEEPTSFTALFAYLQGWSGRLVLSRSYVSKIFQDLSRAGFVRAVPGRNGGYRISRRAAELTMLDVVRLIDGVPENDCCLLADGVCASQERCGVVTVIEEAQQAFYEVLGRETLAGFSRRMALPAARAPRTKTKRRSP
jgi:Rrf2 family protein